MTLKKHNLYFVLRFFVLKRNTLLVVANLKRYNKISDTESTNVYKSPLNERFSISDKRHLVLVPLKLDR